MNYYGQNPNYGGYYPQNQSHYNMPLFRFINGVEEARTFIVNPGQTAYLMDSNSSHLFIKKADMNGRYLLEDYIVTKAEQESTDYVSKKEFSELQGQIAALIQTVNNLNTPKGE